MLNVWTVICLLLPIFGKADEEKFLQYIKVEDCERQQIFEPPSHSCEGGSTDSMRVNMGVNSSSNLQRKGSNPF